MCLCRYADEPPEKIEVPDPTPSPKYKEQEEQFQKFFYEMSGEVGASNCCSSWCSHVGSLFISEKQKRLDCNIFATFATHADLVYNITNKIQTEH